MKIKRFTLYISIALFLSSVILYTIHYLIFRDIRFLDIYLLDHIAFLPIEILVVVIAIGRLLDIREKNIRIEKLNMVLGTFYSEIGHELMKHIGEADSQLEKKLEVLKVQSNWKKEDFEHAKKLISGIDTKIDINSMDLNCLKEFLLNKRAFLLRLMENPNLLEHDLLTNLMQATFHLLEELEFRPSFENLPKSDIDHLALDSKRVYLPLILQWLEYMFYLKVHFPYLFSLAKRINPFDKDASVIIYE
ncbi:MAG TPA: hypothetical protein PLE74_01610 [Candidatus Cloacimonadota bacterium]|nr:hypothetical protein [Candidatus Cloacimonadota bacterium]HPT70962.1 hypothetical protein [Candidatus Cloacimonadota bacterium]